MLLKLSEYLIFLCILFILPDRFFAFCLKKIEELQYKLCSTFEKMPFKSTVSRGNKLLLSLSEFEGALACGMINQKNTLPQFKFYTDLLLKLFAAKRQEGISLRSLIPELRAGVQKDIQFEKKVSKVIAGGNFQFVVIALATWGFVFFSQQLVEIKLDLFLGLCMVSMQILGLVFFNLLSLKFKKKEFIPYSFAFRELYLFRAFVEVHLPMNDILTESKIMNGTLSTHRQFCAIFKRTSYSVERWKTSGLSPKGEIEELIKELWYSQDEKFLEFIKKLEVLKFVIMALLFLPAYFLYLAAIFKFFMEQ